MTGLPICSNDLYIGYDSQIEIFCQICLKLVHREFDCKPQYFLVKPVYILTI